MPFNGSGDFSRVHNWQQDRDNGIKILALRMDQEFDNFQGGMNLTFLRNGLVPMTANLNLGTNYIIGLGSGSVGALPIRFSDDPNTGVFLNGYNKLGLVSNGVLRLEANTAGIAVTGNETVSGNETVQGVINGIGGVQVNGQAVWHAGNFTPGNYAVLGANNVFTGTNEFRSTYTIFGPAVATPSSGGNIRFRDDSATPRWLTGILGGLGEKTYSVYNMVRGTIPLSISDEAIAVVGVNGTFNATGAITQNGQQVWHAGNFNPANYAALSGATFTGAVTINNGLTVAEGNYLRLSANPFARASSVTNFIMSASGGIAFRNSSDTSNIAYMGNNGAFDTVGALSQNGQQVWHAGNFNPANYAALAGANFSGNISSPQVIIGDAAFSASLVSSNPLIQVDSGDYYQYHRANNAHNFAVGNTVRGSFDANGLTVVGNAIKSGEGNYLNWGTSGLSGKVTRGTAAPSGGSDGDIYLQYS